MGKMLGYLPQVWYTLRVTCFQVLRLSPKFLVFVSISHANFSFGTAVSHPNPPHRALLVENSVDIVASWLPLGAGLAMPTTVPLRHPVTRFLFPASRPHGPPTDYVDLRYFFFPSRQEHRILSFACVTTTRNSKPVTPKFINSTPLTSPSPASNWEFWEFSPACRSAYR